MLTVERDGSTLAFHVDIFKRELLRIVIFSHQSRGGRVVRWSWVNFQCRGENFITIGQGPTALAVGAVVGDLDSFTLVCPFSPLSLGDGPI